MVRRNSKQFVRNVIIASVGGLMTLMIVLFVVLNTIFGNHQVVQTIEQPVNEDIIDSKVELNEHLLILVHNISDHVLTGYNIKENKTVIKHFSDTVRVADAYGKVIPISEIQKGDILQVNVGRDDGEVISLVKSSDIESWKKVSGVTVDTDNKMMNIGGSNYQYNEDTLIIKADGSVENIKNIGPYDVLTIHVYEETIWSIIVNEAAATISLDDLPMSKGTVEIDYSRLINFADITQPIKVLPGSHKLVIRMEGYEVITVDLTVAAGENYTLSLVDADKAYTNVQVVMYQSVEDYTILVGGKTYSPGDQIKLEQDIYTFKVTAEGYEPWMKTVKLDKNNYSLRVSLKAIEEETKEEESTEDTSTSNEAVANTQTVTLNTDPEGATVYVDGIKMGQTPYTVTLPAGNHTIIFEKEGYEIYSTSIQIDTNNEQKSYLYVLTQKE